MIWRRDETRPTRYHGTLFRSALEAKVAEELDGFGIQWEYEQPVEVDGLPYLPDFTLDPRSDLADEFDLAGEWGIAPWLEVKPAGLLYALRDHAGLPERFDGNHTLHLTAQDLRAAGMDEIWKPKRLAEATGFTALVVSAINRHRTLSVLMTPDGIELSRSHPLVCHRQLVADRQRAEREAQWRAEMERQRAAYEAEQRRQRQAIIAYAKSRGRPARYDGWCCICSDDHFADELVIFRAANGRWLAVCRTHLREGGS